MDNHVALSAEKRREGRSSTAMHTPGPWNVNNGARGAFYITAENDTAIASTYEPKQSMRVLTGAADPEANARLIAAAPEMLAALTAIMADQHPDTRLRPDHIYAARLAIAKATGAA